MLISRKLTEDKRVVTDVRHLNVRIAKNKLAYPLLKDTFCVLGSSRCEVLSVLDLKDAFHSLRLSENSKKYCGILPYFGSASYLYQRMPMQLNISPSIHHLDCDEEYIGETSRTLGERRKEHLKQPSPMHGHSQTTGHSIENNNFNIIGREDQGQARTIKESIYIRVNNPTIKTLVSTT